MILPILTLALSPPHALRLRTSALKVFHKSVSGWFSAQMTGVLHGDLENLLQAVGDPFQFVPDLFQGQATDTANYDPMMAVVVLVEFASSDLWRNHLQRSNFTSCEENVSTEEGRGAALRCMPDTAAQARPESLRTSSNVIAAIRRLEELQCPSTARVVAMWAQKVGLSVEWGVFGDRYRP